MGRVGEKLPQDILPKERDEPLRQTFTSNAGNCATNG